MRAILLASAGAFALGGCSSMATTDTTTASASSEAPASAPAQADAAMPDNILLADWSGAYDGTPPFDKVTPAMFPEAIQYGIDEQRREYQAITRHRAAPTFETIIVPMEKAGERLGRVMSVFSVMTSNMTTPEYQALSREWGPKLSAASDEITLDPMLFQRIKAVYDNRNNAGLNAQQIRLVERYYDSFVRRGANLNAEQKQQLSAYNAALSTEFSGFSEKVLADESTYITATEAQMKGVPADIKGAAAGAAKERNLPAGSYAIVNTRSAVDPVLTFGEDRALREQVWRAFISRGDNGGANDTNATIAKITQIRADRAKLLGYKNHAEWRMQDTMAKTPAAANELMMRVWPAAVARVKQEVADQQAMAKSQGQNITIEPWDYRFYQEKVRKDRYDLSADEVKPYFELNNIIDASYWAAGELFGLDFKEITGTVPTWHPDIRVYSVTKRGSNDQVGVFYRDDYARTGKRSGAWATTYRSRAGLTDKNIVLGSNNNNFVKPPAGQPALISLDDAETLFHEFGHALHYFISNVEYPSFNGTPRDFVEYPSQVNENWLLTQPVLSRFAKHYQTGEVMPAALIQKIEKASTFNQGFATVEYLSSAIVDMEMHTRTTGVADPDAFEKETLAKIGMPKEIVMRHRLPQFNHLFSSDAYSAGYYSYLWSETMDADTWALFEERGVFDKATADGYAKWILSTGNEIDRAEAYREFRGRDPEVNALLKKRGFPVN